MITLSTQNIITRCVQFVWLCVQQRTLCFVLELLHVTVACSVFFPVPPLLRLPLADFAAVEVVKVLAAAAEVADFSIDASRAAADFALETAARPCLTAGPRL